MKRLLTIISSKKPVEVTLDLGKSPSAQNMDWEGRVIDAEKPGQLIGKGFSLIWNQVDKTYIYATGDLPETIGEITGNIYAAVVIAYHLQHATCVEVDEFGELADPRLTHLDNCVLLDGVIVKINDELVPGIRTKVVSIDPIIYYGGCGYLTRTEREKCPKCGRELNAIATSAYKENFPNYWRAQKTFGAEMCFGDVFDVFCEEASNGNVNSEK